jgi:hypothetical protein
VVQSDGLPLSTWLIAPTRLFDGVPKSYTLELVSSTVSSNGIVALQYGRHR